MSSTRKTSIVCKNKYPNTYSAIGLMFERQKLLEYIVIEIQPMHMRKVENELKKLNKKEKTFPNKEYDKENTIISNETKEGRLEFEVFVNPVDDQSEFLARKYYIQNADKFLDDIWEGEYGHEFFEEERGK